MKPIYKSVILTQAALAVSLSLQAKVYNNGETATQDVPAESLQGLRVQLVSPNVSGARDLIASGECTIDGATLNVSINAAELIPGTHRLVVKTEYGTQTVVLYGLDITVPTLFEEGDAQEFEDTITVVSTFGDGGESTVVDTEITENSQNPVTSAAIYAALEGKADTFTTDATPTEDSTNPVQSGGVYGALAGKQPVGNYADGSIYQVGESGEEGSEVDNVAKVTAYSIELCTSAQALGYHSVAFGSQDEGTQGKTIAIGDHSFAHGNACVASGDDAHAEGSKTVASGSFSHAEGELCIASATGSHAEGYNCKAETQQSHAEGLSTLARGGQSHSEGQGTQAIGSHSHAEGHSTRAYGANSHSEGYETIANSSNQHVSGKYNLVDTNGDYALIVGNGADDQNRSNAFAIDWNGNLVLFNAGTPVVLTPAKLATLIA